MVLTALGQTEHKVASDIVWTMDLGVGMDWNGVLPITRRLEPHMCHFCGILSGHAETMQYIQMNGYANNPTTQIN